MRWSVAGAGLLPWRSLTVGNDAITGDDAIDGELIADVFVFPL